MSRIVPICLALLFVLTALSGQAPAAQSKFAYAHVTLEARVIELTNIERHKHGLPPLQPDARLRQAAIAHSEEMVRLDYFAHESPTDGLRTVSERARVAGCTDIEVGENIAFYQGYNLERAARRVVSDWMNSPGHRANILRRSYTSIGIGIAYDDRRILISQEFAGCRLTLEPLQERVSGDQLWVRLSGRSVAATPEIAIFDDKNLVARVKVDRGGRFSTTLRLPAASGTHSFQIGTLVERDHSAYDIYSVVSVNTNRR